MDWVDLLFLHWPVDTAALRPHVPAELELETFDGAAWVGVVPFRMARTRARFAPPVPTARDFPELNVRTYVRRRGEGGVWFFSLDAASRMAVEVARRWFGLPYFRARMACEAQGETPSADAGEEGDDGARSGNGGGESLVHAPLASRG